MGFSLRLCLFLLLAFSLLSSATRTTFLLSDDEKVWGMERRSLKVSTNDYDDPSANRGHDPPSRNKPGGGGNGGRRG